MPSAPCTHSYTGVTDTTHFTAVHQHTRSRGADPARWTLRACRRSPPLTAAARSLRARRSPLAARHRSCSQPPPSSRRSRRHRRRRDVACCRRRERRMVVVATRRAWGPPPDTNTAARALRARQARSDERRWQSGDRPWHAMHATHATHARIFAAPPHATALRQRAATMRAAAAARRRVRW